MRTIFTSGVLIFFTVLTVVLLKNQRDVIPHRDVVTSMVLLASCLLVVAARLMAQKSEARDKKTAPRRPESFHRVSNRLMNLEILFTLVLPWMFLKSSSFVQHSLQLLPAVNRVVEYLLVPHLYFFQAQIVGEALLFVSQQDEVIFPYTCVANACRALPLATWIQRAIVVMHQMHLYNPFHWLMVVGMPLVCATLWLYSSLIFIPLKWYPLIQQDAGRL